MSSSFCSQPPLQISISMPIQLSGLYDYLRWKSIITPILISFDLLDLAEGRELCPPQFLSTSQDNKENQETLNPAYTQWTKKDQILLAVINGSLSHHLLRQHAVGCKSGRALWLILEDLFARETEAQVKRLKHGLENLKLKKEEPYTSITDSCMSRYIGEAIGIVNGLHAAGVPVDDREVVSCVLKGLPSECDELVTSIRDRPEPVNRDKLFGLLRRHRFPESRRDKIERRTINAVWFLFYAVIVIAFISFIVWLIRIRR